MLIYNEKYKFGITWNVCIVTEDWIYGSINFIIGEEIFPKKFDTHFTLGVVFGNLRASFEKKYYDVEGTDNVELGDRKVDNHKLDSGEESNIFSIETTELGNKFGNDCSANCLRLSMGYSGDEERLFYSDDFGESYVEIRMPKGTVEDVIMRLPIENDEIISHKDSLII